MINSDLIKILKCIECGNEVLLKRAESFICAKCKMVYPIKKEIPIFFKKTSRIKKEDFVKQFYDTFPYDIDPEHLYSEVNLPKDQLPDILLRSVGKTDTILDVGCGAGRYLRFLNYLKCSPVGIDQSYKTLKMVKKEMETVPLLNASNLNLPVKDSVADWVISAGVIHHTGDTRKAFKELIRVCKPKGKVFLMVYRKWSNYYIIYVTVGSLLRFIYFRMPIGKVLSQKIIMPMFNVVDNIFNRKKRTLEKSISLYADYFLQPIATFHTNSEIIRWCKEEKVVYKMYPNNHHIMVSSIIQKR